MKNLILLLEKINKILHFSTLKALTNFVWETVDPSRVEADNAELLSVLGSLSGGMTGGHVTSTTQLVDCDCDTDPECVCEEEEEEEIEEEEETEEEEEMDEETGEEEEKKIEKKQEDDDRPADFYGEEEVDLLELQDESEINYEKKAAALDRKIELLEDLLESETVEEERETLRGLLEKAWSELESLEEEGGEEVLGTEAMAVLKAQIEEDDRKKAKDEL
jgi:hypothetical protein